MARLLIWLIRLYQAVSRSFLPRACRFYPSCSHYALEAIQKYGAWKGLWMAIRRVIRCSPFTQGGYDPVR
ncbi:MAG: membrane protein insertion efficiency factor YidD [Syntrophales bacterium]|nr:membrane protein insertion efficiency factor YidD [Syntrophales bacterium]